MVDLFGDTITAPRGACAPLLNAAHGFPEFWQAYPKGPRKADKQKCLDKWAKYGCAADATHILAHLAYMQTTNDWRKDAGAFICAPLVYLNRMGWVDWTPEDVPVVVDELAKIKAHKGAPMPASVRAKFAQLRLSER